MAIVRGSPQHPQHCSVCNTAASTTAQRLQQRSVCDSAASAAAQRLQHCSVCNSAASTTARSGYSCPTASHPSSRDTGNNQGDFVMKMRDDDSPSPSSSGPQAGFSAPVTRLAAYKLACETDVVANAFVVCIEQHTRTTDPVPGSSPVRRQDPRVTHMPCCRRGSDGRQPGLQPLPRCTACIPHTHTSHRHTRPACGPRMLMLDGIQIQIRLCSVCCDR